MKTDIAALQAQEAAGDNPQCATQFLTHGKKTAHVIAFVHGYSNCPQMFMQLGQQFYALGYNVLIVPLPHHGLADRLTDVHPDGFSRLLCDGILRARYRGSAAAPVLLTPNQIYEYVVDVWATANTFLAGHRIRVAVTSSSFPRFDRNLNTGGLGAAETARQVAVNTIFHDARRMSRIILPGVD